MPLKICRAVAVGAVLALGTVTPASAAIVTYSMSVAGIYLNYGIPGGFPQGVEGTYTVNGKFTFDTVSNTVDSFALDAVHDGNNLGMQGATINGYGPSITNAFTANTWSIITAGLYVNLTFEHPLSDGTTDNLVSMSLWTGYTYPTTTNVSGAATSNFAPSPVPEPASVALFLTAIGLLGFRNRAPYRGRA
jgi:hypothetical protein